MLMPDIVAEMGDALANQNPLSVTGVGAPMRHLKRFTTIKALGYIFLTKQDLGEVSASFTNLQT